MEFLTDDPVAQAVSYQRVIRRGHHAAAATVALLLGE
jgi:hypothetical protein